MRGPIGGGRGRGGRGSRARGRGPAADPGDPGRQPPQDAAVRDTDTDAAVSRLSAVDAGYLHDPFARVFVCRPQRRMPIINRGTYARTVALDAIVDRFLASSPSSPLSPPRPGPDPDAPPTHQIVSLGAGTDTRSLRLFSSPRPARLRYHEIDFPAVCRRKLCILSGSPELSAVVRPDDASLPCASQEGLPEIAGARDDETPECSWASARTDDGCQLLCHGINLRALAAAAAPEPSSSSAEADSGAPTSASLSPPPPPRHLPSATSPAIQRLLDTLLPNVPTLLLSECCLCYLTLADAAAVVRFFYERVPGHLAVALYEPTRPDDAFGRVMAANLAARAIHMPTLTAYPRPADQEARLRAAGFDSSAGRGGGGARCVTVDDVWDRWVPPEEKERLDALEGLDEVEEWELLARHYVVAWGWRGDGFGALASLGEP